MSRFLGLDTSNYRTSAALYDGDAGTFAMEGRLLSVEAGQRGLRQSDALFLHTRALPEILTAVYDRAPGPVEAVGVSDAPRSVEGSYMPCFLAGVSAASAAARALGVPLYRFSHQMGHVAAAAVSAGVPEWLEREFLCWHLSGGTTELVRVRPGRERLFDCDAVFATSDISAGQAIDRAGVYLGLSFPCGGELEQLAARGDAEAARPSIREDRVSLSGLENQTKARIDRGDAPEDVAAFVQKSVIRAVEASTEAAMSKFPGLSLLCGGGVSANGALRRRMEERFGARFPAPAFAGDNAAGIAYLTSISFNR